MAKIYEVEGWIDLVQEEILDPNIEIIDPHHHLWHGPEDHPGVKGSYRYLLEDLWKDTSSGHNIKKPYSLIVGRNIIKRVLSSLNQLVKQNLLLKLPSKLKKIYLKLKYLESSGTQI